MRALGHRIEQISLAGETGKGTFVPPTIIEMKSLADLKKEVFGPVLHVIRFKRDNLDRLIDEINATGYGLTFGLHTRLDDTIQHVLSRVAAGNLYVNRNIIGAVVGVQPLAGEASPAPAPRRAVRSISAASHKPRRRSTALPASRTGRLSISPAGWMKTARALQPKPQDRPQPSPASVSKPNWQAQSANATSMRCIRAARCCLFRPPSKGSIANWPQHLPPATRSLSIMRRGWKSRSTDCRQPSPRASRADSWEKSAPFAGALIEGDAERVVAINKKIAALPGPLVLVQAATTEALDRETQPYNLDWLMEEVSVSVNTTAAGGNASLMSIG